jgi:hypothetical protein
MLKNAESKAELKGLDVDSLVIEHLHVNKAPQAQSAAPLTESMVSSTHPPATPAHWMIFTEKEQIAPKPGEGVTHKKQKFMAQE